LTVCDTTLDLTFESIYQLRKKALQAKNQPLAAGTACYDGAGMVCGGGGEVCYSFDDEDVHKSILAILRLSLVSSMSRCADKDSAHEPVHPLKETNPGVKDTSHELKDVVTAAAMACVESASGGTLPKLETPFKKGSGAERVEMFFEQFLHVFMGLRERTGEDFRKWFDDKDKEEEIAPEVVMTEGEGTKEDDEKTMDGTEKGDSGDEVMCEGVGGKEAGAGGKKVEGDVSVEGAEAKTVGRGGEAETEGVKAGEKGVGGHVKMESGGDARDAVSEEGVGVQKVAHGQEGEKGGGREGSTGVEKVGEGEDEKNVEDTGVQKSWGGEGDKDGEKEGEKEGGEDGEEKSGAESVVKEDEEKKEEVVDEVVERVGRGRGRGGRGRGRGSRGRGRGRWGKIQEVRKPQAELCAELQEAMQLCVKTASDNICIGIRPGTHSIYMYIYIYIYVYLSICTYTYISIYQKSARD